MELIKEVTEDTVLIDLWEKYLYCKVQTADNTYERIKGIVQGSSLSPVLSNLYLNQLDYQLECECLCFCRFADNINVYAQDRTQAVECYEKVRNLLNKVGLQINENKCGVFPAINRLYLGYAFEYRKKNKIVIKKFKKKQYEYYRTWHQNAIQSIDKNFHIINDGILTKRDYTLLFENEEDKRYLPVETTNSLNIYSDIILNSGFLEFVGNHNLRISFYNKYGKFIGAFYPEKQALSAKLLLKQATIYNDEAQRVDIAKKMLIATAHNMRSNLRYYKKRGIDFAKEITSISEFITQMNESKTIQELMLTEARCRQKYYQCFDRIINTPEFPFQKRTKRPPENAVNAMISFGNVLIYERIATEITKTSLDVRIGILHAIGKRNVSLNLDIAEIFKPLIVDRVIFMMIHRKIIREEHFEKHGEKDIVNCKKLNK